jgi:mevalonate kinase
MAYLSVEIDDELWFKFRDVVKRRYGGIKGFVGKAVEEALELYIDLISKNNFKPALELLETQEETKPVIYTIGYEGRSISNLVDILQKHGIQLLVDVRELPLSRKNGFSKTALREHLNKAGIEYISIRELGTPKEIRHDLRDKAISWQKFKELYMKHLDKHMDAVKRLEELAKSKPTAIMCYEKDWRVCHRSIIAEYLEKDGFEVIHL